MATNVSSHRCLPLWLLPLSAPCKHFIFGGYGLVLQVYGPLPYNRPNNPPSISILTASASQLSPCCSHNHHHIRVRARRRARVHN